MINRAHGIDISADQGNFDWESWKDEISFAMVRATTGYVNPDNPNGGYYTDPRFAANWEAMKTLGIRRFAYHFAYPTLDERDPVAQAEHFMTVVREAGLHKGDNVVLDLEENSGMTPIQVSFWAWVFCTYINRHAPEIRVLVYTYDSFADEGYCARLGDWYLWMADYQVAAPQLPAGPWTTWKFWQYTGSPLDRDVFNGTPGELDRFCVTTGRG